MLRREVCHNFRMKAPRSFKLGRSITESATARSSKHSKSESQERSKLQGHIIAAYLFIRT